MHSHLFLCTRSLIETREGRACDSLGAPSGALYYSFLTGYASTLIMSGRTFVFMVLEEHPYGREMLMQIMDAGHAPIAVIEEASDIAEDERDKFLGRI